MADRRVVVTGLGISSALGNDWDTFWQGMLAGAVGIDRIGGFDPAEFDCQVGGEVGEIKVNKLVPKFHRKAIKLMSRDIELVVIAADGAVRDAGLKTRGTVNDGEAVGIEPTRSGVIIGAGLICCDLVELGAAVEHAIEDGKFSLTKWGSEGMAQLTPLWLLKYLPNMLGCHVSIIHDFQGPNNSITCAEVSGLLSIGEAYQTIKRDRADVMVAGGAECKINPMSLVRQSLQGRLSTKYNDRPKESCRPFDQEADGTVLGEGGGIVVLEELEQARSRGAKIYAEITGFGVSCNFSDDFVTPEPDARGITIAIEKALQGGDLSSDQVDLLVPHGLGVLSNDQAEARAIVNAFGDHARELEVQVTKSRVGNCGAGAAAIDFVSTVLALTEGKVAPMVNCEKPLVECGLMLGGNEVRQVVMQNAVCSSYTYGGQTAAMLLSKFSE